MASTDQPTLDSITATFADFFRDSPLGMKVLNRKNEILYANQVAQDLLGRGEEELRQIKELELVHAADLYRFRGEFDSVANGATDYAEVEARHCHAEGHWVPLLTSHMRLPPTRWPQDWVLEIGVDVSKREELAQQVIFLQSKQLLGQMARGIAHDFNNLLGVISMKIELLEQRVSDEAGVQETLAETNQVLEKMRKLSRNLAEFGSAQRIKTETLDLNERVREMKSYFEYVCPNSIRIELRLGDGVPRLNAAAVQLEQVLLNLVVNARDAIVESQGKGTIEICTALEEVGEDDERQIEPGRYVLLSVHDDGVGMSTHTREQIFEPFFTTKGTAGSGVGLSTVYAIVEQGRGYIDVKTERGEGTAVRVFLPADRNSAST